MSRKKREPKICPICGKEFYTRWRTCSIECGKILRSQEIKEKWRLKKEEKQQEVKTQFHPCPQCGKMVEPWKKFCNNSCAATYNNLKREKGTIHWSEEKRKAFSENQYRRLNNGLSKEEVLTKRAQEKAKSSREVYDKQRSLRCYIRCAKAFGIPLDSSDLEAKVIETLKALYFEDRMSVPELFEVYNIPFRIIQKIFKRENLSFRSFSENQKVALETGRKSISGHDPRYEQGHLTSWEGKDFLYRSSYEKEYAEYLDSIQEPYLMEDLRIRYFDTQLGVTRVAVPDFHLTNKGELVEIKSNWTYNEQNMKDKFKAYREAGYKPRLILDKKEVNL